MIVEVIPKVQVTPIDEARLSLAGFNAFYNFDPSSPNLGSSGSCGNAIFVSNIISAYDFHEVGPFHGQLCMVSVPLVGSDSLLVGSIYRSPSSDTLASTCQLCKLIELAASLSTHLEIFTPTLIGLLVVGKLLNLVLSNFSMH